MITRGFSWNLVLLVAVTAVLAACGDEGDQDPGDPFVDDPTACFDEEAFFSEPARKNTFAIDPKLADPLTTGSNDGSSDPDFAPVADSPVLSGGDTPPDNGFFDTKATFIGAIGSADWTVGWTSFPIDTTLPDPAGSSQVAISGVIETDATWTADNVYVLEDHVFVKAELTIEPGTVIRGKNDSALVITVNGSIDAQGTPDKPIVFTSTKETGAAAGDWGGLVLVGKAPINVGTDGTNVVEGFLNSEEEEVRYGGTDQTFDCGTVKYVRIEYAGFKLSQNNEINGLTIAGCGSDTELDFIQIHRGLDDGVEFFGGTADVKHLVVTLPDDDGVDWDFGWQGRAQFVIVQQDANNGDKGFECDNNENNNDATPRSAPQIWNATVIGSSNTSGGTKGGMHLRRGTGGTIVNTIIAYFGSFAVDVDDYATVTQTTTDDLNIASSFFYANADGEHWPEGFDLDSGTELQNDCEPTTDL